MPTCFAPKPIAVLILLQIFTKIGKNEPTTVEHRFKPIMFFSQNCNQILNDYRNGKHIPAFIIGLISGRIIELIFSVLVYNQLVWNFKTVGLLFLVYVLIALMGALSLIKFRDYEK